MMQPPTSPLVLIILDGWGYSETTEGNAIAKAKTPHWDRLWSQCPHALLKASGNAVGLPDGQMGNSEVGHLHIGAGRLVPQDLTRIDQAIKDESFFGNRVLNEAVETANHHQRTLHLIGLLSDGGVHSHLNHLKALIRLAYEKNCHNVCIHAILDGRDTPPQSALQSIQAIEAYLQQFPCGSIVSVTGRYFAMDRDKRWDRTQSAYDLMVSAQAHYRTESAEQAVAQAYERGETDEFVSPTLIQHAGSQGICDNDSVIFFNFRADRARQLSYALTDPEFDGFTRTSKPSLKRFVTLTEYDDRLAAQIAFPPFTMNALLGEVVSQAGLKQLRLTETEKYAHVTFFFNGGQQAPYPGESRELIASPKVSTYDLAPEMSAAPITDALIYAIKNQTYDFIVVNFANADMVGHTGDFDAAVQAIEALDQQFGRINEVCEQFGGTLLITADHGNAEKMKNPSTAQAHTAHTSAFVPLVYKGSKAINMQTQGSLKDIAPTILRLLNLAIPDAMTGHALIEDKATNAE